MVLRAIQFWFRKDSIEQISRDEVASAQHEKDVASGEPRVLARATDGNLHSYLAEEYGADRGGRIPIGSVAGHVVWTGMWAAIIAALIWASVTGFVRGGTEPLEGSDWIGVAVMLALVLTFTVFFIFGLRDLIQETKAAKLRRQRGVPRPIE